MTSLPLLLGACALFLPVVLILVAYDLRWIALSLKSGRVPPWGTYLRLLAAAFCHGGAFLLVAHQGDWPQAKLTYWLHMTLDPGLTFYAVGLYELYGRALRRRPS